MTDTLNGSPREESESASAAARASGGGAPRAGKGTLTGYLAVGVVAIILGAGATFVAMRSGTAPVQQATTPAATAGHDVSTMAASPAIDSQAPDPESGAVYISPARQQLIGVRTAAVARQDLSESIRTVGTLAYDETGVTQIHTKIAGWIDQVYVDFVGKPVQKGQPLFTIYSPDLVGTQKEYLLARKAQQQLETSRFEETRQGAASLLAAARARLALWDVSEAQIAELERTGEPRKTLTLYAPSTGVVLERNAFSGQYVTPEMAVFKIADLRHVWAIGQVAEAEGAQVRLGQTVAIELSNVPGARPLTGRITFIYPDVDPATRRIRFRAEIANPGLALKPDTFVTLTIEGASTASLTVPAEAVIDTGVTRYVILALANGYFEPRVIHAGSPVNGYYPVEHGLVAGDRVVTSAQFLIDSETNLQAAMQAMATTPGMEMGPKKPAVIKK